VPEFDRMKNLLIIDSSARVTRSITRHLTQRFAAGWKSRLPESEIVLRDVGLNPPAFTNPDWISAAFSETAKEHPEKLAALKESETLINELFRADAVVIGVPMYNFGVPAQLKSYIDQIVRVGRTFGFNADAVDPYIPLIPSKPVVVITSTGAGGYEPGGPYAQMNFLNGHLEAVLKFIGLSEIYFVRVGFEEFQDQRLTHAMSAAEVAVDELVEKLTGRTFTKELLASHCQVTQVS